VEDALLRRTDVRLRRVAVDQAEVGVLLAESDSLARLDLEAGVSYAGLDRTLGTSWSDSMATRENVSWNVGLVLEIPIGNRAARAALERAVLNRSRLESLVRAEESSAAVRVRNTRRTSNRPEQIDAAALSTRWRWSSSRRSGSACATDKSTTFEVLQLESDLTDARLEELRVSPSTATRWPATTTSGPHPPGPRHRAPEGRREVAAILNPTKLAANRGKISAGEGGAGPRPSPLSRR